ncbi:MAG TPA: lactonase family protein [Planctomycetota bacterium]|nr:lactonase family protein [Planctomycetota bacterium]
MKRALLLSLAILASIVPGRASEPAADKITVYVGSYADVKANGIHQFTLDMTTGALSNAGGASGVANPSFVAVSPDHKYLYAIGEVGSFNGKKGGAVSSFAIDEKSGALTLLSQQTSGGDGPCFVTADRTGKVVLVANYGGGSVESLPVADGKLGEPGSFIQHKGSSVNKSRQGEPHAHSINVSPDNKFAFACDLGLDKILVYKLDPDKGTLTPNDPPAAEIPPGSGPRHFAFHPSGKFAYVCGEMTSTVHAMTYDAEKGVLKVVQTLSTLPNEVKGNSTAETQVHPSGKWVYVSNRGHDSVAVFKVDEATGHLTAVGHQSTGGKTPRNFGIDPSGKFLIAANQSSNNVVVFKIDEKTGMPTPTGTEVSVPKPVCVKFLAR